MLRRLFACLALLTGLAAGAPAQAHIGQAEIARIEAGLCKAVCERANTAPVRPAHSTSGLIERTCADRVASKEPGYRVPSVRLGIDRTRE